MKKGISICLFFIAITIYSCKKEKKSEPDCPTETATTTSPNYSALKVGNYWIYERFEVDEFGNSTSLNIIDSCYIEKDTVVNGQQYFKYVQPQIYPNFNPTQPSQNYVSGYIKDSLSYIISYPNYGFHADSYLDTTVIMHSSVQLSYSGLDTLYSISTKMTDKEVIFSMPAGTFKTVNEKTTYIFADNNLSCNQKRRYTNRRRAENIGIVFQDFDFYHALCKHWDRRLIRYHVVL